jgi:hypothetical protein
MDTEIDGRIKRIRRTGIANVDKVAKSQLSDGTVKNFKFEAHKS